VCQCAVRGDMARHRLRHHGHSMPYICPTCLQGFASEATFTQHWTTCLAGCGRDGSDECITPLGQEDNLVLPDPIADQSNNAGAGAPKTPGDGYGAESPDNGDAGGPMEAEQEPDQHQQQQVLCSAFCTFSWPTLCQVVRNQQDGLICRWLWMDAGVQKPDEPLSQFFPASNATEVMVMLWRLCFQAGSQESRRGLDWMVPHPQFNKADWPTEHRQNKLLNMLPIIPAFQIRFGKGLLASQP
jgi:hypothetical protein